jgi:hypothetical protein
MQEYMNNSHSVGVLGGMGQAPMLNPWVPQSDVNQAYDPVANTRSKHMGTFEVVKVENGFILRFAAKQGEKWTEYIATTVADMTAIFVTALVGEKLDK